jgi:hypothetical protein
LENVLSTLFVIVSVNLGVMLPFFRQGVVLEDSLNGTNRLAGPAINALLRVDIELMYLCEGLRFVFCRMYAIDRANIHTGGIFIG